MASRDRRHGRRHQARCREAEQALGTCGARAFSPSPSDFHPGGRAPICSEQRQQAQRAPRGFEPPGGWIWFGYDHTSSPGQGCVTSSPSPVPPVPSPTSCTVCFPHDSTSGFRSSGGSFSSTGKIPKLNFPAFDGDNPKLWISRAQDYFELCPVESSAWIKVATMHFTHSAGRWLPSVQNQLKTCSWSQFCQLVLGRFGHDQHA